MGKDSLLLPMHLRRDFQAQAVQADEAGGVVLVVGLGRVGFHRGDVRVTQTAAAGREPHATRAQFQPRLPLGGKK